jgi:hypothetical protein
MNIALATINETVRALAARSGGDAMGMSGMASDERGANLYDPQAHG